MSVPKPAGILDVLARIARHDESGAAGVSLPPGDWPNRSRSRKQSAGGLDWHLQRDGAGRQMLLLHGTGASTHSWGGLLPLLAEQHDVLAPDLPGHGFTSAMETPTLPDMARAVGALLEAERFEPEVIVGHSAGAALALELALGERYCRPSLVIGINAALAPYGGLLAPVVQPLARLVAAISPIASVVAARASQPDTVERLIAGTGSSLTDEGIAGYRALLSRETHVAATLAMMAYWDLRPLERRLKGLVCPLFLIVGDGDRTVPPSQANRTARQVSRSRVRRLPGLGHLAHEERPAQVAEAIREAEAWNGKSDG